MIAWLHGSISGSPLKGISTLPDGELMLKAYWLLTTPIGNVWLSKGWNMGVLVTHSQLRCSWDIEIWTWGCHMWLWQEEHQHSGNLNWNLWLCWPVTSVSDITVAHHPSGDVQPGLGEEGPWVGHSVDLRRWLVSMELIVFVHLTGLCRMHFPSEFFLQSSHWIH